MYTTFVATITLAYFVMENPESNSTQDILKDAMEGKELLAKLAKRSMAADRSSQSLAVRIQRYLTSDCVLGKSFG